MITILSAHNYAKLFFFKAYIATHKFDIICISETYLDSSTPSDDNNLEISGYTLVRSDHLSNNKRDGVCIYYKFLHFYTCYQYLQETCNFSSLYRSPSQIQEDFETY